MQKKRLSISYDVRRGKPDIKQGIEQLREQPVEYSDRSIVAIAGLIIQKYINQELKLSDIVLRMHDLFIIRKLKTR